MKKIKLFYLEDCPYCHYAKGAVAELKKEKPEYSEIDLKRIREGEKTQFFQ